MKIILTTAFNIFILSAQSRAPTSFPAQEILAQGVLAQEIFKVKGLAHVRP